MSVVRAVSVFSVFFAFGCGASYEPGVEVRVVSAPVALEREEVLESVPGQSVHVFELYWTSSEFELLPCESWASRTWDLMVPNARAHGISTPERLSTPVVERATGASPVELGVLHPAATQYCNARYRVGTADADAVGIEQAPDMAGHSMDAQGLVEAPSRAFPFSISSVRAFEVVRPIMLDLSRPKRVTIAIERDKRRWFQGLAFDEGESEPQERALIANFQDSITLHVE